MLILSRKVGQSIVINGNVVVKVLSMDQGNVRLGIQAPPEVQVHREGIQRQRDAGVPARGGASVLKAMARTAGVNSEADSGRTWGCSGCSPVSGPVPGGCGRAAATLLREALLD